MSAETINAVGLWSYGSAALAFLVLTLLAAVWRREVTLLLACAMTAVWALIVTLFLWSGHVLVVPPAALEVVQCFLWILFLWRFVSSGAQAGGTRALSIVVALVAVLSVIMVVGQGIGLIGPDIGLIYRILLTIVALLFLENLFRNTARVERWRIKFYVIGLGGMFVYDLYYYANFILLTSIEFGHVEARGWAYALAAVLIAIATYRSRVSAPAMLVSRQLAFYSTTVLISGAYIVAMSATAVLIRHFDDAWGTVVQLVFLFSALLLLLVLLSSGAFRAHVKVLIDKHFFSQRYDYRNEWLRFTRAIADSTSRYALPERILHAVADTFESPGAALWLKDGGAYSVVASWNLAASSFSCAEAEEMAAFMAEREWVLVLGSDPESDHQEPAVAVPHALTGVESGWVLVPLLHHASLTGFIMLARPRAPKRLTWEDFDLMRTVGRQAAGYLAEQVASLALAQAQQFERFNQRSAFVLHDIKNLVSQLSLLSRNLERHGENPEFRRDMALTLDNVLGKMQQMISRLSARDAEDGSLTSSRIDLAPLLREVADSRAAFYGEEGTEHLAVQGDRDRLASLFGHLLNNAQEAVQGVEDGWVRMSLLVNNDRAIVEVSDNGPGMDEAFIRDHLFAPFRSTKSGGFGIGTHQCRVYARELGGDLEVVSSPGAGTTVRVLLPIAAAAGQTLAAQSVQAGS